MNLCPVCKYDLTKLNSAAPDHVNQCIDANTGNLFREAKSNQISLTAGDNEITGFICPICPYTFDRLEELERHITQCLMNEQNKQFQVCQPTLTLRQQTAVDVCHRKAKIFSSAVCDNITTKLASLGSKTPSDDLTFLERYFQDHVRLIIHFKIDNVLDYFLSDEFYLNLFETRTSGGSNDLNARRTWENNLFKDVYANSEAVERVKYGALNLTCCKTGVSSATSYGESFLTIRREVHDRISFCVGDSSMQEMHMATFRYPLIVLNLIPLPLLKEILHIAKDGKYNDHTNYAQYIEGQVHGPLSLKRDVESLNVPKIYQKNEKIMRKLERFVDLYNIPIFFF